MSVYELGVATCMGLQPVAPLSLEKACATAVGAGRLRTVLLGTTALVAVAVVNVATPVPAGAQTTTWTGAVDGLYFNEDNWSNGVPYGSDPAKDAIFDDTALGNTTITLNFTSPSTGTATINGATSISCWAVN